MLKDPSNPQETKGFCFFDDCPVCQRLKKQGIRSVWLTNGLKKESPLGAVETLPIPETQVKIRFALKDIIQTPLFLDTKMFLEFVAKEKPKLTQIGKNLTRKDIYFLNSQLQKPDQLDLKIGSRVWKLKSEPEAETIHFINILCQVGKLVRKYRRRLRISRRGKNLLDKPKLLYFHLWQTYIFHLNWGYFVIARNSKVIEELQDRFGEIALFLLETKGHWISSLDFLVRFTLQLNPEEIQISAEKAFLEKLEYFALIKTRKKKDCLGFRQISQFQLTSLGEKVLKTMFL